MQSVRCYRSKARNRLALAITIRSYLLPAPRGFMNLWDTHRVFMWRTEIHWGFFSLYSIVLTPPFSVNWTLGPGPFLTSNTAWNRNTLKTMHFNENKYDDDFICVAEVEVTEGMTPSIASTTLMIIEVKLVVPFSIELRTTCTGASTQCLGHVNKLHEWYW